MANLDEQNVDLEEDEAEDDEAYGGLTAKGIGGDGKGKADAIGGEASGPKLSESLLGRVFTQSHVSSALSALSQPGKDVKHLSMRTSISDVGLANAIARHWAKCIHFEDRESEEELLLKLALHVSIGGVSRRQVVEAIIGAHTPGLAGADEKGLANKVRKFLRLDGDKDE